MATFDFVSNPDVIIPEEDYREAERLGMDVHSYRAAKAFEEEHPIGDNVDIVPYTEENREAITTYQPETQILTRPTSDSPAVDAKFATILADWEKVGASARYEENMVDDETWTKRVEPEICRVWASAAEFHENHLNVRMNKIASAFVIFEIALSTPVRFYKNHPRFTETVRGKIVSFVNDDARITDIGRIWSAKFEAMLA